MLGGLELVAAARDFVFAFDGFDHGFEVEHLPLNKSTQNLVRVLHLGVQVVKTVFQVPLFLILEENKLVGVLRLGKSNVWHFHGVEAAPLHCLLPVLLKHFDVAGEDIPLILIEILVQALVAAPFGVEVLLHLQHLILELLQEHQILPALHAKVVDIEVYLLQFRQFDVAHEGVVGTNFLEKFGAVELGQECEGAVDFLVRADEQLQLL